MSQRPSGRASTALVLISKNIQLFGSVNRMLNKSLHLVSVIRKGAQNSYLNAMP